jgi:hypothetical protein
MLIMNRKISCFLPLAVLVLGLFFENCTNSDIQSVNGTYCGHISVNIPGIIDNKSFNEPFTIDTVNGVTRLSLTLKIPVAELELESESELKEISIPFILELKDLTVYKNARVRITDLGDGDEKVIANSHLFNIADFSYSIPDSDGTIALKGLDFVVCKGKKYQGLRGMSIGEDEIDNLTTVLSGTVSGKIFSGTIPVEIIIEGRLETKEK